MASHSSLALLRVLADGAFHSGAALGGQFNMTRAGVHHHIRALRRMGVVFESAPNKGYRILGGLSLLDPKALTSSLPAFDIHFHDTLASTQDYLLPLARQKPARPQLCVTEYQTQGRGRGNKTWQAWIGGSLCFSMCVVLRQPMHSLSGFTLAMGVALREALANMGATGLQLKWPNDLYHESGAKLAGVLTEAFGDMEGPTSMVIGVGLNVGAPPPWKDLKSCMMGLVPSRQALLVGLSQALFEACHRFETEGFAPFLALYSQCDYLKGRTISFQDDSGIKEAVVLGVGERGELLLDREPFTVLSVSYLSVI